jgi:hypothetical protein
MQIWGTTEQRHEERLCLATFAACFPRAVRTDLGKLAMVRFRQPQKRKASGPKGGFELQSCDIDFQKIRSVYFLPAAGAGFTSLANFCRSVTEAESS